MATNPEIGSAASSQIRAAESAAQRIVKTHKELHHYTGAVGLKGIVESNSMWATYFADMNDAQEIHSLRVPLVNELAKRLDPVVKQIRLSNPPKDHPVWKRDAQHNLARIWGNALYRVVFTED